MKNIIVKSAFFLFLIFFIISEVSCKKRKTNDSLYEEAKAGGLIFYKGKDTIYGPAGGSPHGQFKLKFNSTAVSKFDGSGKIPKGATFDNGSLIVKEVYSGGAINLYAVMKKDPDSKFSSNGWLWAEYEPNGKVKYNVSLKGEGCVPCHSSSENRDLTRSFDLH